MKKLTRDFYQRDACLVARELLGKLLVHTTAEGRAAGVIVETEAYIGAYDKGAHSYPNKRTARTEVQFGPGGFAYTYQIYGMHTCFNVVTNEENVPEAVLIRALEPIEGIARMERRRKGKNRKDLCNGPGKLCQALDITKSQYGADLCGEALFIEEFQTIPDGDVLVSPRINIDYAEECRDYLWRYFIRDNAFVSKAPKGYTARPLKK